MMDSVTLTVEDDGESDISFYATFWGAPDISKHASLGSLVVLAILELDRDKVLNSKVEELLAHGPLNQIDVRNRINAILNEFE